MATMATMAKDECASVGGGGGDRRPLAGRRVLVTRAGAQAAGFEEALRCAGAEPVTFPTITIDPAADDTGLDTALRHLDHYDWIVFTSANTVTYVEGRLQAIGLGWDALFRLHVAAVGPKVAEALRARGVAAPFVPDIYTAAALTASVPIGAGERVLLPQADIASPALAAGLRARGASVDPVVAYRTTLPHGDAGELRRRLAAGAIDAVTFASPSSAHNLCVVLGDEAARLLSTTIIACIGPSTARAVHEQGLRPAVVAAAHTVEGLIEALEEYYVSTTGTGSTTGMRGDDLVGSSHPTESPAEGPRDAESAAERSRDGRSEELFAEAQRYIPGGVDSPVRAFKAVGGAPRFIERGEGPYLYDADGNRYIDYVLSYGPLITGHAQPEIVRAIGEAAARGTSYGAPTRLETELARRINGAMPSMELTRFVSSGTEATMSALRVARAYTGRDVIVKVEGGYHGHSDGLLARAGSAATTLGVPDSPGVPAAVAATTVNVPLNDLAALEEALQKYEVAAFILEPVPANMGVVPPAPGYLEGARALTQKYGALLIFDEVITGFRVAYGGAQGLYGVTPDLTCLGKIIGGGLPVGAYGGRRDAMSLVAPLGPVYQAGTLSGNPLAMTAGITMLDTLAGPGVYEGLEAKSRMLHEGLLERARRHVAPAYGTRVGSIGTLFFTPGPVTDYTSARASDTARYARFFHGMLERGVYLAPAQFEAVFVSTAHAEGDIEATLQAAGAALSTI